MRQPDGIGVGHVKGTGKETEPRSPASGDGADRERRAQHPRLDAVRRRFSFGKRLLRLANLRLIIPLKRSPHPPDYSARGVMIGLFWAFTPLVGIQMPLIFLNWLVFRMFRGLNFSLIIAMAWTWVTNVFTLWPVYYVFYVTGGFFIGRGGDVITYADFVAAWQDTLAGDDWLESVWETLQALAYERGLPLAIGWIPYAFGSAALGYHWSVRYITRRRRKRAKRIAKRIRAQAERKKGESTSPVPPGSP